MSTGYRRIYYDKETGNKIADVAFDGGFVPQTVERDIEQFSILSERNRETFDVLELPFGAFAQDFAECTGYRVNVETKTLEFSYPDPNAPDEPPVFQKPLTEQVLELKQSQVAINRAVENNSTAQQDLLELLIDMGVI